jgi:hypothetical protein
MLSVAQKLVASRNWPSPTQPPYRQAKISLREQGGERWKLSLFGSDSPSAIDEVARQEIHVAIINPGAVLNLAVRGTGPFKEALPLRAIAVIPSLDQIGFAISESSGLTSLLQVRERRFPLRVGVRGQRDHSLHLMVREVLLACGFSPEDIVRWGGTIVYEPARAGDPMSFKARLAAVKRGEIDAVFDEGLNTWVDMALDAGMRFVSLEESVLQKLEKMGLRRGVISREIFPRLERDVMSVDFSGWPIYTHAEVEDHVIASVCAALEASKAGIPWQGDGPLPLETMCRDTPDGPLDIPLHPAAERFWRERGYLA